MPTDRYKVRVEKTVTEQVVDWKTARQAFQILSGLVAPSGENREGGATVTNPASPDHGKAGGAAPISRPA